MRSLITTARLHLQPFRHADTSELHDIFSDSATHTIGDGPFTCITQTRDWITRRIEAESQFGLVWYAVRDRATGQMLGNCGLFSGRTGTDEPEIGYEIRHTHQGQGLASEAAQAVLNEGLSTGIPRVWATIRPHNTASIRVASTIGMICRYVRQDARGQLVYLSRP